VFDEYFHDPNYGMLENNCPNDLISINTKKLGADRVAQMVECLPSKCKALSSNPSTEKRKKKKKRKEFSTPNIPNVYVLLF
jgi:hypothetical protein